MKNNKIKDFVASIKYDCRLLPYDVEGSIAHCRMLAECKIISQKDSRKIIGGLKRILESYKKGRMKFSAKYEDIHLAVEAMLIKDIGETGGKLHTARSRNDQVSLDMRLYMRDIISELIRLIEEFQSVLRKAAVKNIDVIMPGFTHLQHAQPVLFSQHIMAYFFMLKRDGQRLGDCLKRVNVMPLGAAALAGTAFPIDRAYVAKLLGFEGITSNSIDTVSDRDFIIEFISAAAILMMHLSRFTEDLIIWLSPEFDFIRLGSAYCTGSSIMPQKRNPDVAELIRGKTGRVYGNLLNMLTVMKGLPVSYNRDMQEDKMPLFDTVDTLIAVLEIFPGMLGTLKVNKEKMLEACRQGFLNATDVADYLVGKGLPFRKSHGIVSEVVSYCIREGRNLQDLKLAELRRFSPEFAGDVFKAMNIRESVAGRKSKGGTAPREVRKQIKTK